MVSIIAPLLFPSFSPSMHCSMAPPANETPGALVGGLDLGWQSPSVFTIAQHYGADFLHVLGSIQLVHATYRDIIAAVELLDIGMPETVGVDRLALSASLDTGRTGIQCLADMDVHAVAMLGERAPRINAVRGMLAGTCTGPRLTFDPRGASVTNCVQCCRQFSTDAGSGVCTTPQLLHQVDALLYCVGAAQLLPDWHPSLALNGQALDVLA